MGSSESVDHFYHVHLLLSAAFLHVAVPLLADVEIIYHHTPARAFMSLVLAGGGAKVTASAKGAATSQARRLDWVRPAKDVLSIAGISPSSHYIL